MRCLKLKLVECWKRGQKVNSPTDCIPVPVHIVLKGLSKWRFQQTHGADACSLADFQMHMPERRPNWLMHSLSTRMALGWSTVRRITISQTLAMTPSAGRPPHQQIGLSSASLILEAVRLGQSPQPHSQRTMWTWGIRVRMNLYRISHVINSICKRLHNIWNLTGDL